MLTATEPESAYLLAKGNPRAPEHPIGDVLDWTYSGNRLHPTQKPLSVLTPLIESFCPRGGLVLDPFAGSGSTLVAARMAGRKFLGIELDAEFHEVATRRMVTGRYSPSCAHDRSSLGGLAKHS